MSQIKVNEIFYSIQGEGTWVGTPVVFVRLSGCNLKCKFCDTKHEKGNWLWAENILERIQEYPTKNVVITGGEPTLQDIYPLVSLLRQEDYYVAIETNGTGFVSDLIQWKTVSPKRESDYYIHPQCNFDEIKLVVDKNFNEKIMKQFERCYHLWLQPDNNKPKMIKKAIELVKRNPKWRLSLQVQKIINVR